MALTAAVRKLAVAALLGVVLAFSLGGSVQAHITLDPAEAPAGGFVKYTVRVPTERDVPTVRIRVEFPAGVVVSRFLPKEGWQRQVEKDSSGRVTAVTWSGGNLGPDEFEEFAFLARNPSTPGKIVWKAYQTYQDGTVVEWTGPESSDRPAPVTMLTAPPPPSPEGGAESLTPAGPRPSPAGYSATATAVPSPTLLARETTGGTTGLAVAFGAGGLALIALMVGLVALARSSVPRSRA